MDEQPEAEIAKPLHSVGAVGPLRQGDSEREQAGDCDALHDESVVFSHSDVAPRDEHGRRTRVSPGGP